jgi:hypothetical protein
MLGERWWVGRIHILLVVLTIPILASLAVGLSPSARRDPTRIQLEKLENSLEVCSKTGLIALVSSNEQFYTEVLVQGLRLTPFDWLRNFQDSEYVVVGGDVLRGQCESTARQVPEACLAELRKLQPLNDATADFLVFQSSALSAFARATPLRPVGDVLGQDITTDLDLPQLSDASGAEQPSLSLCCHVMLLGNCEQVGNMAINSPGVALRALTDEQFAEAVFGKSPFVRTRHGVRYLSARSGLDGEKPWAESHRDQCLASFAALGVPLHQPLVLKDTTARVHDLLAESIANFSLDQAELAWTAIAYSHFLAPQRSWQNRFAEECSFSTLLTHLIDTGYDQQSCGGMHVLESIIAILDADGRNDILTPPARARGHEFLVESMELVIKNQRTNGDWGVDWSGARTRPDLGSDVLVTGHMLDLLSQSRRIPPSNTAIPQGLGWATTQLSGWSRNKAAFSVCP